MGLPPRVQKQGDGRELARRLPSCLTPASHATKEYSRTALFHNGFKHLLLPAWYHDRQDAAGQNTRSPNTFASIGSLSPTLWVARGYAVLDGPTLPIVAEVRQVSCLGLCLRCHPRDSEPGADC